MNDYYTARDLMDDDYNEELDAILRQRPRGITGARAQFDLDYDGAIED
jgi:hypothetical protein